MFCVAWRTYGIYYLTIYYLLFVFVLMRCFMKNFVFCSEHQVYKYCSETYVNKNVFQHLSHSEIVANFDSDLITNIIFIT